MLRFDVTFFNKMYGAEMIFISATQRGESVSELEFQDVIRGWKRLARSPAGHEERLLMCNDERGVVDLKVHGESTILDVRPVIGPEAWGLLPYSGPAPMPEVDAAINAAFRTGRRLQDAAAAAPHDILSWWGEEEQADGRLHYYILRPPALLIVATDAGGIVQRTRTMDHRAGASHLMERLRAHQLLPIPLSRQEDYAHFRG